MSEGSKAAREAWRREWRKMRERNAAATPSVAPRETMTLANGDREVVIQWLGLTSEERAVMVRKAIDVLEGKG